MIKKILLIVIFSFISINAFAISLREALKIAYKNNPEINADNTDKYTLAIMNEISLLQPWYDHSLKEMNGRKLDGLTSLGKDEIINFLVDWTNDQDIKVGLKERVLSEH